jgi:hypothetical protein
MCARPWAPNAPLSRHCEAPWAETLHCDSVQRVASCDATSAASERTGGRGSAAGSDLSPLLQLWIHAHVNLPGRWGSQWEWLSLRLRPSLLALSRRQHCADSSMLTECGLCGVHGGVRSHCPLRLPPELRPAVLGDCCVYVSLVRDRGSSILIRVRVSRIA